MMNIASTNLGMVRILFFEVLRFRQFAHHPQNSMPLAKAGGRLVGMVRGWQSLIFTPESLLLKLG